MWRPQSRVPISLLAIIYYVLPVLVLLPGVIFGNIAEAVMLVSVVSAGLSKTACTYMKEKPGWVGPRNEKDDMRLLVLIRGDKWYLISGINRDIKTATALASRLRIYGHYLFGYVGMTMEKSIDRWLHHHPHLACAGQPNEMLAALTMSGVKP